MIKAFLPILLCISKLNSFAGSSIQTLTGRWIGTYGINENNNPYYFSFAFATDSTVITYTAYKKSLGSW
jgi:hypothetical protein